MSTCAHCHHFEQFVVDAPEGVCLAHPPVASVIMVPGERGGFRPENFTAFPSVNSKQRCGEWTKAHPRLILTS